MINLATNSRGDALRTVPQPLGSDDSTLSLLPVSGSTPIAVTVNLSNNGSVNILAFSTGGGATYSDGIEWKPTKGSDAALFITFTFTANSGLTYSISSIDCPYSQVAYSPTVSTTQYVSVLHSDKKINFPFSVSLSNGQRIDPKIKITPP